MNSIRDRIVKHLMSSNGCRLSEIKSAFENDPDVDGIDFMVLLNKMVAAGEVIEIEYVIPISDERGSPRKIGSFFLPGNARII